jgi:uncharacterized protein (DUF58 family)
VNAPVRGSLRLTPLGRSVLILAASGLVVTLAISSLPAAGMLPAAPALLLLACAAAPALAWLQLRGLRVSPPAARTVFVGEPFQLRAPVTNFSRWFTARDLVVGHGDGVRGHMRPVGYHPVLAAGATEAPAGVWRLPRRGHTASCTLTLASSFPFGLVERRLVFEVEADLLALPRLGTVRAIGALLHPAAGARRNRTATHLGCDEFHGLREWREGESQRLVHWKLSARRGRLVVRELEGEDRPPVRLVLSGFVTPPYDRRRADPAFERAVSLTATLVEDLLRNRYRLRLAFAGDEPWEREAPRTRGALRALLTDLARVQPTGRRGQPSARALFDRARRAGETAILVIPDGGPRAGGTGDLRAGSGHEHGLVLHVDHPAVAEIYSPTRRAEPRTALLAT